MRRLGREHSFPNRGRNEWALAKCTAADEVARKIREVRELCRRRKAASRRAKKSRTDPDYIERVRSLISCV